MKPQPSATPDEYRALLTDRKSKGKAIYALGRLPKGHMNATEEAFSWHLEARKLLGEVDWWEFEGMTFRLADLTVYTPDFDVMLASGELQCWEIKGAKAIFRDDARAKIKIAAARYPLRFFVAYPANREMTQWEVKDVADGL